MKPVVQQKRTGCGIANGATVAGVSYRWARCTAYFVFCLGRWRCGYPLKQTIT